MLPFSTVTGQSDLFREVIIRRVREETSDVKSFELELVGDILSPPLSAGERIGALKYKPGQFITFVIPTQSGLVRRSYSMSSLPGEPLTVTIKRVPNGVFSRPMLETAAPGDRLTIAGGAFGFFTLPEQLDEIEQVIFLAVGSGITPILPMIRSLMKRPGPPMLLAYGNKSVKSTMFREELEHLERQHPDRLHIEWYFSDRQDLHKARLGKTAVELLLNAKMTGHPERTLVYLCGPFDFMRTASIVLQVEGIKPENIKREVFTPEPLKAKEMPPDIKEHGVEIHIRNHVYQLNVKYPDTILSAAKAKGIELPYSCEAGRCGSCIATCSKGSVWMRYNEVLTEAEVAKGRILTCQSFPVKGDVEVTF